MEGGADIESFLNKVEEIESIVKGLNSSKDEEVKVAVQKADEKLAHIKAQAEDISSECKTGVNRTVINKSVKDEFGDPKIQSGMSQELFMKAMEDDAKERAQRRKVNEKAATKLKEEGNEEFKSGNYEKAVELYSKALNKHRDSHVLYTNRAMALIKLQKYQEALSDCDWALRAFPNATKAFVHQGKAYLALGNFDEARNSYKQGLQTDPKKKKVFEDYLAEVDRVERAKNQEEKVQELFDSGSEEAGGLVELLEKVKKADQLPLFYAGGFRVIAKLLTGEIEKTLFRTQGGLRIHVDHQTVQRCLSASPRSLSQEELDLLSSVLELLSQACFDNETSQEQILEVGNLPAQLPNFLDAKLKGQGHHLKEAIVSFLHCLSLTNVGRCKIVQSFELSRLTNWAFACTQSNVPLAVNAVGMLNNLALDQRFRQQMRDVIEDQVVPAFEALIEKTCGSTLAVLPSSIHMVVNLAGDGIIRKKLMRKDSLWKTCISALDHFSDRKTQPLISEILQAILALLVNMSSEVSPQLGDHAYSCCVSCLTLTTPPCSHQVVERCVCVLSLALPHSPEAVDWLTKHSHLHLLLTSIQSENSSLVKPALKSLTVSAKVSPKVRQHIVDNNGIPFLVKLLKSVDESMVGNAALCLGYCIEIRGMCASLADTTIVKDLLVLARDGKIADVQQNCGILLAKLAQGDKRHLERLRELHGIEILHQACGKNIK
ncbi:tetratricopeptide repeat protein 12-like isoform X1 [Liolophura sinensis]|uniref:tetratricopeptide repeat protein 12-like isoform X1 n=1 Tax=Liolophura sinensis TaxID=3198878 RepID=UPI0031592963